MDSILQTLAANPDLLPFEPQSLIVMAAILGLLSLGAERAWRNLPPARLPARQNGAGGVVLAPLPAQRGGAGGGVVILTFGLADLLALALLPLLRLSYGPVGLALFGITGIRLALFVGLGLVIGLAQRQSTGGYAGAGDARRYGLRLLWLLNLAILACSLYGLYWEPHHLQLTRLELNLPANTGAGPATGAHLAPLLPTTGYTLPATDYRLQILHLSDLHVERITQRELDLMAEVKRLQPDIVVWTGDYVNIEYNRDPATQAHARAVLAQIDAPCGVYAVSGTPAVDLPEAQRAIFNNLAHVRLLRDEIAVVSAANCPKLGGDSLYIIGVSNLERRRDAQALLRLMATLPTEANTLLLYHTPDLIAEAAHSGVDLYLGGHTHGGQIQVPFYGALVTSSAYGRRYYQGLYRVEGTQLYISRGLGMEGLMMPRARFLAPPEMVLITLTLSGRSHLSHEGTRKKIGATQGAYHAPLQADHQPPATTYCLLT